MGFVQEMEQARRMVEARLLEFFIDEGLQTAMRYSLLAGGKRIRPVLAMKFCEAAGGTMEEALDYVRGLPPALLGLEGSSMEDYRIYALDGMALIDGIPCIPVGVYRTAENTDTNVVEGSFFLASDQSRIYRLDTDTGTVEEVAG